MAAVDQIDFDRALLVSQAQFQVYNRTLGRVDAFVVFVITFCTPFDLADPRHLVLIHLVVGALGCQTESHPVIAITLEQLDVLGRQ